jgi:Sulfotransferase domain
MADAVRLAMWSGPRNISTALMRAFGNRPDTLVCDEPLYAHYLKATGLVHPGADEVIRCHEPDWRKVVAWLTGPVPEGKRVFYQKHMTHHLLPEIERGWLGKLTNTFLIRDPREMIVSLDKIYPNPKLEDTGLPQQVEIFELVRRQTGRIPCVIDARDVLLDPPRLLRLLCDAVGLDFTEDMLAWPPGPRMTDGVWAKHWYGAVLQSTGFEPYRPREDVVPQRLAEVHEAAQRLYRQLHEHRLGQ